MKKLIIIIFIGIFSSCNYFFELSSDKDLTEKINTKYLNERKPIDLTKITDFEWDNYIILFLIACVDLSLFLKVVVLLIPLEILAGSLVLY
jgi:hypothetical protein